MRSRNWPLAASATAAILTLTACGGGGAGAGDKTELRIASNSNTSALPAWVATDKKLCEKHDIELKFTKIENIGTLPPAMGKSFDLIFTTPVQAITASSEGIPVAQVAGASIETKDNEASYLMVGKNSDIKSLKDLAGKTIGVLTEVGTLHSATLLLLKKAGVPLDSLKIVQVDGPTQADQLKAGRVDAVETVRPFNKGLSATGATDIGTPFSSLGETISPIWWGADRSWAEKNKKVVKNFQACLSDAIDYIAENDAEARSIMQKYTELPEAVAKGFELPEYDATVRPQDIEKWLEAMREVNNFKADVDLKKLSVQP